MNIDQCIAQLNPQQREAVLHIEGPLLVLAGAGSGKTRVITTRVAYLLSQGIAPDNIVAVTFTNKAANEMRQRVMHMLNGSKRKHPHISTFHSLCMSILRREIEKLGYRKDFTIYDTSDQNALIRNLLSEFSCQDKSFKLDAVIERISKKKNEIVLSSSVDKEKEDDDASVFESICSMLYPKYHETMQALNAVDFDDLLILTLRLFRNHPDVLAAYQDRFRYLMVDEYQDTNYTQYQLVQLLAGQRKNLCVVGDDDQSIYGWRGANLGNILNFEHDFPGAHVVRLEQNYRSCRNILHAANSVIKHNKKRMKKTLWSAKKEGSKINIFLAEDADDEAQWVADRIELLKFEQNISYNDIAIIYRTNLFSRPFEEALRRKRIPYSVIGGMSYFDHREIKDLAAYLKICANPCDDISLLRIVNIPKRGLGPGSIRKLTAFAKDQKITLLDACRHANEISDLAEQPRKNAAKLAHLIDHFTGQFATNKGMGATFRSLINEINYRDHLHELYKNPQTLIKRIDDYEDFISSLAKYEDSNSSPTLHGFLETIALSDMVEPKEDKSSYGVTLISIHSSKGLEYPIVFIVGVEEGILPHKKSASDIEEERRLFYVGITRAMSELYITHTSHRTKYGKVDPSTPSRFLEEISLEITRKLNRFTDDETEDTDATADKFFAHIQKLLG